MIKDKEGKLKLMKYELNVKAIQEKEKLKENLGLILSKSLPKIDTELNSMNRSWLSKRDISTLSINK